MEGISSVTSTMLPYNHTSLVPRRRIERLVSNVYACAEFFLTFQEYRIFPITFVAHLRHFQQLWLCSMMHYATRFKY